MVPSRFYKHMALSIAGQHRCGLKLTVRLNTRTIHCLSRHIGNLEGKNRQTELFT